MTTGATPAALTITCATCGTESTGARFCPSCGAPLQGARCGGCDSTLLTGARYCHRCGTAAGAAGPSRLRVAPATPWVVAAVALLALVVLIVSRRSTPAAVDVAAADPPAAPAAGALDISAMSPAERADRLFDRVMRLHEEGKDDSVQFFRPMVLSAYQMIGPLDLDQHYDLGEIGETLGMMNLATAEADTILRAEPKHSARARARRAGRGRDAACRCRPRLLPPAAGCGADRAPASAPGVHAARQGHHDRARRRGGAGALRGNVRPVEQAAWSVNGVRAIAERLRVRRTSDTGPSDTALALAVLKALEHEPAAAGCRPRGHPGRPGLRDVADQTRPGVMCETAPLLPAELTSRRVHGRTSRGLPSDST